MSRITLKQVLEVIDGEIASLPTIATVIRLGGNNCDVQPAIDRLVRAREFVEAELKMRGEPVYQHKLKTDKIKWFDCSKEIYEAMESNEHDREHFDRRILYTAPPAPKIEVTDAMTNRLACWMIAQCCECAAPTHAKDRWVRQARLALKDVLKETP